MSLADLVAEDEDRRRSQVLAETWGHLAPMPGVVYRGGILFAHSPYGNEVIPVGIAFASPDQGPLDDSPWLYEAVCEHLYGLDLDAEGGFYRWVGTYRFPKHPDRAKHPGGVFLGRTERMDGGQQ